MYVNIDKHGGQQVLTLYQRLTYVGPAVEYLHGFKPKLVVHCNLKPSNILLESDMVTLARDFGFAGFINLQDTNSFQSFGWNTLGGILDGCRSRCVTFII